jgi:ribosomal protein L16 Arg81 hydroxylase
MEHYDLHEYPHLSEELKSYWKDELPSNLKEKSYRERLIPGSLLYLPRGLWHATSASNFSISINITFSPPTLLEIALAAIRQNLVKQDLLRKNPLSLKKEDYETVNKYLNIIVQNLDFEEIEIQLQENQDKYQVADKAFHSTLELLDA